MSPFSQSVNDAMLMLAEHGAVFVGQSVRYDGAAIYHSLDGVPMEQRIELPVIENFQMGYCTGLAIAGKFPVCIYPRMDFMLLAMDALVNHLDKLPFHGWNPKIIIRTTVGQKTPLDAGHQHTQNYTRPLQLMLHNVRVDEVRTPHEVESAYQRAVECDGSYLIVENPCID
jgi:pyruvate/2-oxoglutarate/acetoin dehydrogenase E1 component